MSFPVMFIWFLIAIFIFRHHMKKNSKATDEAHKKFWDKEEASLVVRKKDLEEKDFLHPALDPSLQREEDYFKALDDPSLFRQQTFLFTLLDKNMVNFAHISNTDLRLQYGTANLTIIEAYEDNYNNYIRTLYRLAKGLYEKGETELAQTYLEEGIRIGTDISGHFMLLAKIYKAQGNMEAIETLLDNAHHLESLTKNALIAELDKLKEPE